MISPSAMRAEAPDDLLDVVLSLRNLTEPSHITDVGAAGVVAAHAVHARELKSPYSAAFDRRSSEYCEFGATRTLPMASRQRPSRPASRPGRGRRWTAARIRGIEALHAWNHVSNACAPRRHRHGSGARG